VAAVRVAGFAALIALGGCSQAPAPAPAAQLWTLFDVEALYAGGALPSRAIAANDKLPGGISLSLILEGAALTKRTALADGQSVEFLTTEVWANYAAVWMQPAYVPITGWANGAPQLLGGPPWHPIFSVGPTSGFYSPFWQIVYAQVPSDAAVGSLTSARQILDGGYPLTPSDGRTMPLVPDDVAQNLTGVSVPVPGEGWLDGTKRSFLDFGSSTFGWDPATNVVEEAPIYVLTFVGADGSVLASPEIPTVLGAGPPGIGVATPGGTQRDSAYWRVNTVVVPETARVFAPPQSQLAMDPPSGFAPLFGFAAGASDLQNDKYLGHVALNPSCFSDPSLLDHDDGNPNSCLWLDSEAALQANLDLSTEEPTAITLTWEIVDALAPDGTTTPVAVLP
jgi:hypothetical protein